MDEQQTEIQTPTPPSAPSVDISKTTIVVLVLVTLMISVIGTWTVLNEISTVKATQPTSTSSGKVQLNILPPNTVAEPSAPVSTLTTGRVALNIVR